MKIKVNNKDLVFVIHQFKTGGVEAMFVNLANKLKDRKIYLILSFDSFDKDLILNLPNNVILINEGKKKPSLLNIIRVVYKMNNMYDFSNVNIINFSDTLSTLLIQKLIKSKGKISWVHCNPYALKESTSFILYKKFLSENDKIICLCDSQKIALEQLVPSLAKKVYLISNFIDEKTVDIKAKDFFYVDYKFILMVSRFDLRTKDFKTVIDAYLSLPIFIQNAYKLVLLGDGPDFNEIKNYCNNENIIYPGRDINPFKWMFNCEFLVHSSLSEGFSLVLLEAMFLGKSVISSDCNFGPDDILYNGKYGFLFDIHDSEALSELMKSLLLDESLKLNFERKALKRAKEIQLMAEDSIKRYLL
ncbi:glycosyltransferase [Photobacterium damselae]|uniref:glycosyltransferase n=1 Tax=Gammaproteobacteria TaxID=1236 RepID=UPI001EDCDE50|nr:MULTISPECIES: glycosyltransferase [Gammaproteobacteria]MCG3813610.1 glycosyltransferase [Photobacterium damselae]MCG3880547.1 glycosyltransferase [Psychrobacter sp. Ps6]